MTAGTHDHKVERISFTDVRLGFGRAKKRVEILDGVDFGVRTGEFVSVLGPSGCGKSTLLNLAAGFLRPDSGLERSTANGSPDPTRVAGWCSSSTRSSRG